MKYSRRNARGIESSEHRSHPSQMATKLTPSSAALGNTLAPAGARDHIANALAKLSDRRNPDYRNSIKESISAVEAVCRLLSHQEKDELGKTLRILEDKAGLHRALSKGFSAIYGYTSDAEGIRHAMMDASTVQFEDAYFMLIVCSAFVNFLTQKFNKIQ